MGFCYVCLEKILIGITSPGEHCLYDFYGGLELECHYHCDSHYELGMGNGLVEFCGDVWCDIYDIRGRPV